MAKYEIMLVVNGQLEERVARNEVRELIALIENSKDFKETSLGLKTMAYEVNKINQGWYFQYNFECEVPAVIAEFRRLVLINKSVLRHLIFNLDKDYGARAINNPKKVKKSKTKKVKYDERIARVKAEREAREKAMGDLTKINSIKKEPRSNE